MTKKKISKRLIERLVRKMLLENPAAKFNNTRLPKELSKVDPAMAKVVATGGAKDGNPEDDKIGTKHQPQGVAAVGDLKPSQSSMNIKKALQFVLNMMWDGNQKLNAGGDLGAFISKDNFIMDGHHRWVATAMIDPTMSVGGYKVEFPGEQLVAILNTMTKGLYGVNQGKPATGGFDQFKPGPMKAQLTEFVEKGVWDMKPEDVVGVLQTFTNTQATGEELIDTAVGKMVANLGQVTFETPAWASAREDMPVIDDANVKPAADALAAGEIDWAEPNVQAAANRKDDIIPENVRRKWGKLIK
jgi:hypothetical protein